MKRIFLTLSVLIICLALTAPSFARDGRGGPKDRVWRSMTATPTVNDDASRGKRQGDEWHYGGRIWILTDPTIGSAVWAEQISGASGSSVYVQTLNTPSLNSDASGVTATLVNGSVNGMAIGATNSSTGVFTSLQANETLGGVSTYGISGNMTLDDPLYLSGRPGALLASSSPIITLPTLSGVSPIVILQDTTTAGNDSGVTVFSPTQQIYSGVGSTAGAGSTIFVNSGNTRFNMTLKAMPVTGGTLSWFVYSFNGNTLRRP